MFQFPRCPPRSPWVPGRAPGGLPHSEIPGSQAASASPGHFAAWPRPSSAANAKASTMRPSCGCPAPRPPGSRRRHDRRPARASGTCPSGGDACPRPRVCGAPVSVVVYLSRVCCVSVRAGERTRALVRTWPSPAAAEPRGFRVAHCQGASRPTGRLTTRRSARSANLVRRRPPPSDELSQPARGRPTTAGVTKEGPPHPGGAAGIRTPDLRRARAALSQLSYGPETRPPVARPRAGDPAHRVGAPGLEPGTSALSGPRSNRLSYAPAARAVFPSSTAAGCSQVSPGGQPPHAQDGARGSSSSPTSIHPSRDGRGAADLPAIRGAPARPCDRLATGAPRGSVPTDAGSPLGDLTRVSDQTVATP